LKNISAKSEFDSSVSSLFDWHMREGAFERLNPSWRPLYIISKKGTIDNGGTVIIRLPLVRNVGINWHIKHRDYVKDKNIYRYSNKRNFFLLGAST
jgi:hypothetical protein